MHIYNYAGYRRACDANNNDSYNLHWLYVDFAFAFIL